MKVSVIVPIYNAIEEVKLLLESLVNNFNFYLGEVILLNDCSNNETTTFLKTFVSQHSNFQLLSNEQNLGFIKTCNKGMSLAKDDIVVLLNSDTIIPKEFCERIILCFNSNKNIGIASPISSFSASYFIELPTNYNIEKMNVRLKQKHKTIYPPIPAAEGFCYCIRKEVIEQQGFLDEIFGKGYHEETDYSYRALANGWLNVLIDDLYVYHKRCCSFSKKERNNQIVKNNEIFNKRWGDFRNAYRMSIHFKNTIRKIEQEIFPLRRFYYISKNPILNKISIYFLGFKVTIPTKTLAAVERERERERESNTPTD